MPKRLDPVFEFHGKWYFWDETWAHSHGPFSSKEEAQAACAKYAKSL